MFYSSNRLLVIAKYCGLLLGSFFWLGCPSQNYQAELAEHRPRLDQTLRQIMPAEKKPLIGLFVDVNSKATAPDGKTWETAFPTIIEAVKVASGRDIYVAAGVYKRPGINLHNQSNIRLIGGYKAGARYEKDSFKFEADELAVLDGEGQPEPLIKISGTAEKIALAGGFVLQNVIGGSAMTIEGLAADRPIKDITVMHSRFENNDNNVGNGGGVQIKWAENVRFLDVEGKNNQAQLLGGFVHAQDVKSLSFVGGTIENNATQDLLHGVGGGLFFQGVDRLKLSKLSITGNRSHDAGGIYMRQAQDDPDISDLEFTDNRASRNGGGLWVGYSNDMRFSRLSFKNNESIAIDGQGGAFYATHVQGLTFNALDRVIDGNKSGGLGGALAMDACTEVTVNGGKFVNNEATRLGGAIFFLLTEKVKIENSKFLDGKAELGAGLYFEAPGKELKIDHAVFENNAVTGKGGALVISGSKGGDVMTPQIVIEHSRFVKNTADGNGGAILVHHISHAGNLVTPEFAINHTAFEENKSNNYGGALALDGRGDLAATPTRFIIGANTTFSKNRAEQNAGGGAIFVTFNDALAVGVPPAAEQRQLVSYIGANSMKDNSAGDGMLGQILRVTNHDVLAIPPVAPEVNGNPLAQIFDQPIAPPGNMHHKLKYFIAYSVNNPADDHALWNRLKLDWEGAKLQVYRW